MKPLNGNALITFCLLFTLLLGCDRTPKQRSVEQGIPEYPNAKLLAGEDDHYSYLIKSSQPENEPIFFTIQKLLLPWVIHLKEHWDHCKRGDCKGKN